MNFPLLLVGVVAGGCVAALAHWVRFDRDRSFYPTLLIIIASYYVLFAFISHAGAAIILTEILLALIFVALALAGALRLPALVGVGLLLHAALDCIHPVWIHNPGVPAWWPMFCAGFDVALGVWTLKCLSRLPEV